MDLVPLESLDKLADPTSIASMVGAYFEVKAWT